MNEAFMTDQPVPMEAQAQQPKEKDPRWATITSRVVSVICSPYLVPLLAFAFLFFFTYLMMTQARYKTIIFSVVANFTVLVPMLSVSIFKKLSKVSDEDMHTTQMRYFTIGMFAISYVFCMLLLKRMSAPWILSGVVLAMVLGFILIMASNMFIHLSEHLLGAGVLIGTLLTASEFFQFNPLWMLSLLIILSGLVGAARICLRRHNLLEVFLSYFIGICLALLVLHPSFGMPFRWLLF